MRAVLLAFAFFAGVGESVGDRIRMKSGAKRNSVFDVTEQQLEIVSYRAAEQEPFRQGGQVCVTGLVGAPEYNGFSGVIEGAGNNGRWIVRLSSGESKAFQPANLMGIRDNAEKPELELRPGTRVSFIGLTKFSNLNGQIGVCQRYNCTNGRWFVEFSNGGGGHMKAANLVVVSQPNAPAAPPIEGPLASASLILQSGAKVPTNALQDKVVAIYFSAHWCGPCRRFTPALKKFYEMLKSTGANFEIVFVSADEDEDDSTSYFNNEHGDWLAVDFGSDMSNLARTYRVQGIPKLVVVDRKGSSVVPDATQDVMRATSVESALYVFSTWKAAAGQ